MRIILSNYRYFMSGGPEKYLFLVQNMLRSRGHEVIPFSVKSSRNQPSDYEKWFLSPIGSGDETYFREYRRDARTMLKVLVRQFYSPEAFLKARAFVRFTQPDLVYSLHFLNKMSPALLDGFKSMGVPIVVRISDFEQICPQAHLFDGNAPCEACIRGGLRNAIRKHCVMNSRGASLIKCAALAFHRALGCRDRVDAYVFPSRFTREKFIEAGFPPGKLHYIPTPVATTNVAPVIYAGSTILFFGRVTAEKGIDHLLGAYQRIPGNRPKLTIIGVQDGFEYSQKLSKSHRDVEFLPFLSSTELLPYIQDALVVVIPSSAYDNLPNTLLEAYALGKPVVAPRHGCFIDLVIDGQTGLTYEPGNPSDLSDKLAWAMTHVREMRAMGERARNIAEQMFSEDRHYDALADIFRSVCGTAAKGEQLVRGHS